MSFPLVEERDDLLRQCFLERDAVMDPEATQSLVLRMMP